MEFKPASQETYNEIGFMSGLEIHQQLLTDRKLFCRCPSGLYTNDYDVEVLRHMRPTLSELGEYDGTALMEFKTKKEIVYRLKSESVCTYEMDDTPPFLVNEDALDVAIQMCLTLNCEIVDEFHISRKQYLDGSIPTGFQRTSIIGVNGWIPYKDGRKVGITQISIEEDSCREILDKGHTIYFKTDRLGMPLIEVVTEPDMRHPDEVAEVAEIIGRLLRATGKVRTGPGATRQDVNVSARGGTRIEIKGVPSLKWIPALTHYEAYRQVHLLEIREELKKRGLSIDTYIHEETDLTQILRDTKDVQMRNTLRNHGKIKGVVLRGMKGILLHTTQPGKTLFHEIVGRLRVISCLDDMPNAYHTDHYPDYAKSATDLHKIYNALNIGDNDVAIIVWGSEMDTTSACQEIILRIEDAFEGVPKETRQALPSGINDFERILPGADRMYPDTDLPPHAITEDRVEKLRKALPQSPIERSAKYMGLGASFKVARALSISYFADLVEQLVDGGISMPIMQTTFYEFPITLSREGLAFNKIPVESLKSTFMLLKEGRFAREFLWNMIHTMAKDITLKPEDVLAKYKILPMLEDFEVAELVNSEMSTPPNGKPVKKEMFVEKMHKHFMGRVMHKRNVKGRYSGTKLSELIMAKLSQIVELKK